MSRAGAMREAVRLQEREEVDDGAGNTYGQWVDRTSVPARIRSLKGSESVLAGRLQGIQPIVITIRHSDDVAAVTTDWRAVNDRTAVEYAIKSIIVDERAAWIDLLVESGTPA